MLDACAGEAPQQPSGYDGVGNALLGRGCRVAMVVPSHALITSCDRVPSCSSVHDAVPACLHAVGLKRSTQLLRRPKGVVSGQDLTDIQDLPDLPNQRDLTDTTCQT